MKQAALDLNFSVKKTRKRELLKQMEQMEQMERVAL